MKDTLVKNFIKLAKIDSISGEEFRVKKYLKGVFRSMGMSFKEDKIGNIFVPAKNPKILLTAHLDTVEPGRNIQVLIKRNKLVSKGKTIIGGDNKAGLALIITLLSNLRDEDRKKVEVLLTVKEEIGLVGVKNFNHKQIKSNFGISFDKSDQKFGEIIVTGTNYAEFFEITLTGEASHSARPRPESNPLNLLLTMFSKYKPGIIAEGSTFNIGAISGFEQVNSSPRQIIVKGDIRSGSFKAVDKFINKLENFAKKSLFKVKFSIRRTVVSSGYLLKPKDSGYKELIKALATNGYFPKILNKGSITDASVISIAGKPTYILSCGVYDTHKTTEYVEIKELLKAYEFTKYFIEKNL